jgi:hypothetical protein
VNIMGFSPVLCVFRASLKFMEEYKIWLAGGF